MSIDCRVRNTDRTVGATIMGALARQHGNRGVPHAPIRLTLSGDAGQSLGAFALPGTEIHVRGTANDGVGKGMHGGLITVSAGRSTDVLIGNAALYGATGGRLFVAGRAGERFAVRNSGATAVVEGVGDHGCEYMTGGAVVVLGPTGANFAAGMTGGTAFVHDADRAFRARLNPDHVMMSRVSHEHTDFLRALVHEHHALTGSVVAADLLNAWPRAVRAFRVLVSHVAGGSSDAIKTADAALARRARLRPDSRGVAADARSGLGV
jgi:glutamate synthase domain-containing protein 3